MVIDVICVILQNFNFEKIESMVMHVICVICVILPDYVSYYQISVSKKMRPLVMHVMCVICVILTYFSF